MPKTVVAMFDSRAEAEQAAQNLVDAGFDRSEIDIRSAETQSAATVRHETESWWQWLFGESEDRAQYSEGVHRGAAILSVTADDRDVERARDLLEVTGADVSTQTTDTARREAPGAPATASSRPALRLAADARDRAPRGVTRPALTIRREDAALAPRPSITLKIDRPGGSSPAASPKTTDYSNKESASAEPWPGPSTSGTAPHRTGGVGVPPQDPSGALPVVHRTIRARARARVPASSATPRGRPRSAAVSLAAPCTAGIARAARAACGP